ncbi:MAG: methionyl-tRNA formyltransferase [Actinomycetota bacterium]|nr:methionyl-tRNA formyltransferase [Actinomycetota bacterium]
MRLVFAGTPSAALPSLEALVSSSHEVVGVVTRPDAFAGRGRSLVPSPVRVRAAQLGMPVLTPRSPRDPEFQDQLRALAPDVCPVVAYGALIPRSALDIPVHGWVNLHFSLLPAWRGAAPVQHAVMAGDDVTGASTFVIEEGLDTGPVLGTMTETIRPADTSGDLLGRLAVAGASLLVATMDGLASGDLVAKTQPLEGISLAPKISVEDARILWNRPAHVVDRQVRGCTPNPGAWTTFRGERVKVLPVAPAPVPGLLDLPPGTLSVSKNAVDVATAGGVVRLGTVHAHGKKAMPAADWARGSRVVPGERFADA